MVSSLFEEDDQEDNFHLNSFGKIGFILSGSLQGHFYFSLKSTLSIKTNLLRANAEKSKQAPCESTSDFSLSDNFFFSRS